MPLLTLLTLLTGLLLLVFGMWVSWLPVSDRMAHAVADAIAESSGVREDVEEVRASVKRDRVRIGLRVGSAGTVLVAAALVMAAIDDGFLI